MGIPLFNIGGLASGLDTASMINELMKLERLPITRYEQRQSELRKVDDAWGTVNTKLSALRAAVDKLKKPDAFAGFVTSRSSNEDAATVAVTGSPAPGGLSFTVTQLAKAHQLASGELAAADASLWSGAEETLSISQGGTTHEITTTSTTTLQSLAADINDLDADLSAQVVQTSPGRYRLVVSASETGTANAVTVNSAPAALGTTTDLQAAADAVLDLGGGITVSRSGNTVDDLIDGVTVELKQAGAAVTITTSRDHEVATKAVKGMVDALNSVLTTLKDLTNYNPDSKVAGVLQGDPTARQLAMDLRAQISATVPNLTGAYTAGGSVGISLSRDGLVTLDEAKLGKALDEDFAAVANLFSGRSGATDDAAVAFLSSSNRTVAGTYGVEITAPAAVATATGAAFVPGLARTLTITADDGTPVVVSLLDGDDAATVAGKINSALGAAGVSSLSADVDGGALRLRETRFGSDIEFSVSGSGDWGLDGTFTGTDVAGTIGGNAAVGRGQVLEGSAGQTAGLALTVSAAAAGSYGSVTIAGGISSAVDRVLRWAEGDKTSSVAYEAAGAIERARNTLKSEIRRYDDQIAAFEVRLESREITLRKKFSAMESALANLQSQTAMLGMFATSG